jgi:hypothetical protein
MPYLAVLGPGLVAPAAALDCTCTAGLGGFCKASTPATCEPAKATSCGAMRCTLRTGETTVWADAP